MSEDLPIPLQEERIITYVSALKEAQDICLENYAHCYLMGLGVPILREYLALPLVCKINMEVTRSLMCLYLRMHSQVLL